MISIVVFNDIHVKPQCLFSITSIIIITQQLMKASVDKPIYLMYSL